MSPAEIDSIKAKVAAMTGPQLHDFLKALEMDERQFMHATSAAETLLTLERQMQVYGKSWENVHAALPGSHPGPVPSATTALHNLPPRPERFVGREADLQLLRARQTGSHNAMLTGLRGMGGIGKTALALVLAHEWAPRFPDAHLFLDARGTHDNPPTGADLQALVIQAFHPQNKLPDDPAQVNTLYRNVLQDKAVLILLDNVRDAEQASPLIPPSGSALIVTSRQTFMLGGTPPHNVNKLPNAEAIALLREFHPGLSNTHAAELAHLCAGLPLALRLAGAHLALDAVERPDHQPDVAGYLHALRSGRLATLDADAPDAGEITISETLRLSEARLSEADRVAWRKLAVFCSSFSPAAAQAVAGADDAAISRLVRRSLLDREEGNRCKVHELAIDYALAQLSGEELRALRLGHVKWCVATTNAAKQFYQKGKVVESLALFDLERSQIEAAFAWLRSLPKDTEAAGVMIHLVKAVVYTSTLRFHAHQRIEWSQTQFAAARRLGQRQTEGIALGNVGNAYQELGNASKAIEFHKRALVIGREIGDRRIEGGALGNIGFACASLSEARKAIGFYEQALAIARKISDRRLESGLLGNLGNAYADLGDTRRAIEFYEKQIFIVREIGDRRAEGTLLGNLGIAYANAGDIHKAIELYELTLGISREIGDRRAKCNTLGCLGNAHFVLGDLSNALDFYTQHLIIAREIGDRRGEGEALGNLGNAHAALGDARNAIAFYLQQITIAREIGDRRGEANALWNSALAHKRLDDFSTALEYGEAALQLFEAIESRHSAKVRANLAEWRAEPGDDA